MNTLSIYVSSAFDSLKRRIIKVTGFGKADVKTAMQVAPFGVDSNPISKMFAIYANTSKEKDNVIIGYILPDQLAAEGETRLFSLDSNGVLKSYVWLKNNGDIEMNGNSDNAVKFSKLKEAFDELQNDVNTLKQNFITWTPAPSDGGAALKTATLTWATTAFVKNINSAKNNEIKTN